MENIDKSLVVHYTMEKSYIAKEDEILTIKNEVFDDLFNVYSIENNFSFFHIKIGDTEQFYEEMFNYFFTEDKLIEYCENKKNIRFTPTRKQFAILYKHLKTYIDRENLIDIDILKLDEFIVSILNDERPLVIKDEKRMIRTDKIGKIGEYTFCHLLSRFFNFDCIIPKVHLQTDYNMNVYGIDTLFYSEADNLLLFGESKLCKNLNNGLNLIKESLKEYENQISDEFDLILSNRMYKDKLNKFNDLYGDNAEICVNIKDFLEVAKIEKIGIPIFIAHGTEINNEEILEKLSQISFPTLFGRETVYYAISLPIFNKDKFISVFTGMIRKKAEEYYDYAKTE